MAENFILSENNIIMSQGGSCFPMTGTDGTANFTANANFSSFTLTTANGPAGCYVNMNPKGVSFAAYPATDVSASWYNIINKTNETAPTTYCYVYPSGYGELDLDTMTAYNKVTVFAPGDYGPDRMLYGTDDNLNHSQKVMPSGLWVEALKNRKEGGQYSWSLINSGWISYNNMWEGD